MENNAEKNVTSTQQQKTMKRKISIIGVILLSSACVVTAACWIARPANLNCQDPAYYNGWTCSSTSGSLPWVIRAPAGTNGWTKLIYEVPAPPHNGDCEYDCDNGGMGVFIWKFSGVFVNTSSATCVGTGGGSGTGLGT